VITYNGKSRDHSSRYSTKSSRLVSAHCMSSNGEHGWVRVGEALEEEAPGGEQVLPVATGSLLEAEQVGEPGSTKLRSSGSSRCSCSFAASFSRAEVGCSSSVIRQRIRTMSASAQ
jgi:hypothetical protein